MNRPQTSLIRRHKAAVSLFILGLIVWVGFARLSYLGGFEPGDVLTYSMLARNIVRGNGIAHDTAKPVELAALGRFPAHDVQQPPSWPIILSVGFLIFGVSDIVIVLTSGFFHWLLIPLVYILAKKMFDEKVAVLSTVITILNLSLLEYSTSGLTESFFTALITLGFILIYQSRRSRDFILIGLLFGVGYLTRPQTIFFLPAMLLFILLFREKQKCREMAMFITAFIIVLAPFFIRNHIYGNGIPLSGGSVALQYDDSNITQLFDRYRSLRPENNAATPLSYAVQHSLLLVNKFLDNLLAFYKSFFPGLLSPFIAALFFAGTLTVSQVRRTQQIKLLVIMLLISNIIGCSLANPRSRYLISLLPAMIIFASSFLISSLEKLEIAAKYRSVVLVFLVVLLVLPLPGYLLNSAISRLQSDGSAGSAGGFRYYFVKDMIQNNTSEDDVIISNNHSIAGWYGDRKVVTFPLAIADIDTIDRKYVGVGGIFLESGQMAMWRPLEQWWDLLEDMPETVLGKFKLARAFNDGVTRAVLYVRK